MSDVLVSLKERRTPTPSRESLSVFGGLLVVAILIRMLVGNFYSVDNVSNVIRQAGILGIVTLGQALALLVGGVDLSVGAVMSVSLVMVAEFSRRGGMSLPETLLVVLAMGMLVGALNGLVIAFRNVPPFVATLAMTAVVGGGQLAYTKGVPAGSIPARLRPLGLKSFEHIPYVTMLWLVLAIVLYIITRRTTSGRHLYATGTSAVVAARAGTRTQSVIVLAYVGSGLLAAIAGIALSAYVGYVDSGIGTGYDLDSISAAVVGGVAFTGGKGGVVGACAGVLFLTILLNLVILAGINPNVQLVVRGALVIAAMAVIAVRTNRNRSERTS
jgi:ribose transport system permease protein